MQSQRFAGRCRRRAPLAAIAVAFLGAGLPALSVTTPAAGSTIERIRETGRLKLGYLVDARPFTFVNAAGSADGYAVRLCSHIATQIKTQLALPQLAVNWVPIEFDSRFQQVQRGGIDLLCAPSSVTAARREEVSFSLAVFPSGLRAVLRADAPTALREALGETPSTRAVWRGSPAAKLLEQTSFAVVSGTSSQSWLAARSVALQISARTVPVSNYRMGLQQLLDGKVDVFFGDRSAVLSALPLEARDDVLILERQFTYEPLALALARNDDEFRLLVDRVLSEAYASEGFRTQYGKWFGELSERTRLFFLWNTLAQ